MTRENVRERKEKRRYTFVIVPQAKTEQTRTFSLSQWALIGSIAAVVLIIVAGVFALVLYTPIGSHLPIASSQLVRQYGTQIVEIQTQLASLLREINILRGYNLRLRKAMGEKVSTLDSSGAPAWIADSIMMARQGSSATEGGSGPGGTVTVPPGSFGGMPASIVPAGVSVQGEDFYDELPLIMPADGYLTRGYDPGMYHYGIDIAGKEGSPVLAAADGNVVFSGWTHEYGFVIMVAHEAGFMTVYKHDQSLLKNTGDAVKRGEMIALLGNTGETSSGPHLHFEVWKDGVAHDPTHYLLSLQ